jgi:hypothetical protein
VAKTNSRVRSDKIGLGGTVTLRHGSKLFHIGLGRRYADIPVKLCIADLGIQVVTSHGELLRQFTSDTARDYQPRGELDTESLCIDYESGAIHAG